MTKLSRDRRTAVERTAYHEAGHAVAACLLHRAFKYATILPGGSGVMRSDGHVCLTKLRTDFHHEPVPSPRSRRRIEREIIFLGAGDAAEWCLPGRHDRSGARWDKDRALELAAHVCDEPKESRAYVEWLWMRSRNLINETRNWSAVKAVAAALLIHQQLAAREIRRIVAEAQRAREKEIINDEY